MVDIVNAFDDCIKRLQRGETMGDCLRRYPEHASQLRPMLETAEFAGRVRINPTEVSMATDRIRQRISAAIYSKPIRQRHNSSLTAIVMAAVVAIAFLAGYLSSQLIDGATVSSDEALSSGASLKEVRQLVDDGELARVDFEGIVTSIKDTLWQVEDMQVTVPPDTLFVGEPFAPGSRVRVEGYTTPRSELFATTITLLDNENILLAPTETARTPDPTIETPPSTPEPCVLTPSTGVDVTVRAGGGVGYHIIGQLDVGDSLPVLGLNKANNQWYAVDYDETTTGWVSSAVTSVSGACDDLPELVYPPLPQQTAPVPTLADDDRSGGNSGHGDDDDDMEEEQDEVEFEDEQPDDSDDD